MISHMSSRPSRGKGLPGIPMDQHGVSPYRNHIPWLKGSFGKRTNSQFSLSSILKAGGQVSVRGKIRRAK